jgi:hypothetical protein
MGIALPLVSSLNPPHAYVIFPNTNTEGELTTARFHDEPIPLRAGKQITYLGTRERQIIATPLQTDRSLVLFELNR